MAIESFNRYELKYLLDTNTYICFEKEIQKYMELDPYNEGGKFYTVSNLYCDTDDFFVIRTSLEKPLYKEKLRLRAYGVPHLDDLIFCEVKKKFRGKVNKRRSFISLSAAYDFIETGKVKARQPYMNNQVINELEYSLSEYPVKLKAYLAYDRKAYFGKEDKKLRISFDTNIRSRFTDLRLEAGDYGEPLLDKDTWLMEIKCFNVPLWLTDILSNMKIYPKSFSKYGNVYKNSLRNKAESIFADSEVAVTTLQGGKLNV